MTEGQAAAVARITGVSGGRPGGVPLLESPAPARLEVYLRCIAEVLVSGGWWLLCWTEIALTPQTATRFESRFPGGGRSNCCRRTHHAWRHWPRARRRSRSAPFRGLCTAALAPPDRSRRGARTVLQAGRHPAVRRPRGRAQASGAMRRHRRLRQRHALAGGLSPVSGRRGLRRGRGGSGELELLQLPVRVDGKRLPEVTLVDMRRELESGNRSVLSRRLQSELATRLPGGEQSILFLNRRGLATFVLCRECGYVARCPHCDVSLVYHGSERNSAATTAVSSRNLGGLLSCGGTKIRYFGSGTSVAAQVK